MIIMLISFAIITLIVNLYKNYINNNLQAKVKVALNGGSLGLGILMIIQYILGVIIIIKIILKIIS